MLDYKIEILLSIALFVALFIFAQLAKYAIRKFSKLKAIDLNRKKVILKLNSLVYYLIAAILLAIIWGVELKEFTVFISSVLAVVGVAFVAQWSILSNLTASVILFFNHPLRIGDRIRVQDKDFDWTGKVEDITGFYVFMKTDKGKHITIPNSIVINRGIEILEPKKVIQTDINQSV
jgi:small-conductance mechanosensitive channel